MQFGGLTWVDYKILTKEDEVLLFKEYRDNKSIELRNKIAKYYYKLLSSIVYSFENVYSVDPGDIFQEGFFGICKAIEKYNVDSGFKFSTYATHWITVKIWSYIKKNSRIVKITEYANSQILKYKKEKDHQKLIKEWGDHKFNQIKILAESKYKLPDIDIEELSSKVEEEDNKEAHDKEVAQLILVIIKKFPTKEKVILRCRYNLNHNKKKTLEDIGKMFKITKERVRQIEKKALERMEVQLKKRGINRVGDVYGKDKSFT